MFCPPPALYVHPYVTLFKYLNIPISVQSLTILHKIVFHPSPTLLSPFSHYSTFPLPTTILMYSLIIFCCASLLPIRELDPQKQRCYSNQSPAPRMVPCTQ
jgi:hypothetical protein